MRFGEAPGFLPDRLRPQGSRRRSRRGLVLLTAVPVMLLTLPQWRVQEVTIDGCSKLPPSATRSLRELVGEPALDLDLESIRDQVQVWPGVGRVQVELELPGTIRVQAEEEMARGSVRVGRSWHGVGRHGDLTGMVGVALPPVLEGFETALERRRALATARRVEAATEGRVASVRRVTLTDYRVAVAEAPGGDERVIHVRPEGTLAELAWCSAFARGEALQPWADLRWPDRMVVGSGG